MKKPLIYTNPENMEEDIFDPSSLPLIAFMSDFIKVFDFEEFQVTDKKVEYCVKDNFEDDRTVSLIASIDDIEAQMDFDYEKLGNACSLAVYFNGLIDDDQEIKDKKDDLKKRLELQLVEKNCIPIPLNLKAGFGYIRAKKAFSFESATLEKFEDERIYLKLSRPISNLDVANIAEPTIELEIPTEQDLCISLIANVLNIELDKKQEVATAEITSLYKSRQKKITAFDALPINKIRENRLSLLDDFTITDEIDIEEEFDDIL